ncbi:hypothetical protein [Flagellimonas algicola]|uniref:DUF4296 domain-containing protein n=1 Tax=Flagellimonas algicola TaxID=2583815 RepID=A0ABY2WQV2_9FLAO|nr:hypothetical protein [Allomuricauda algicola]TMU57375.1 hypothetical protein FGG15_07475 [Allomuricauda algicola]
MEKVKNYKLLLFLILILGSCRTDKRKTDVVYPFRNLVLENIIIEKGVGIKDTLKLSNKLRLKSIEKRLGEIDSSDLLKGKRIHGASTLCNAFMYTNEKKYLLNISKHPTEGIIANFLEQKQGSEFQSYLGAYLNADEIYELLVKESE